MIKKYKFIILVILAIISLVLGEIAKKATFPPAPLPSLSTPIVETDWQRGTPDSEVKIVMYGNFACPTCNDLSKHLAKLATDEDRGVLVVYRHFASASSTASRLAAAAEAAGKQNKFWAMHDLLFERQPTWLRKEDPSALLLGYAASLHLNLDRFQRDIVSESVLKKIEVDYQSALSSGVVEAPTIFLNNARVQVQDL